jgi:hypothetical protein
MSFICPIWLENLTGLFHRHGRIRILLPAHKIVLAPDLERFPVLAWFLAFRFRRKPGRYLALIRNRLIRPGHARGPGIRLENNIKS